MIWNECGFPMDLIYRRLGTVVKEIHSKLSMFYEEMHSFRSFAVCWAWCSSSLKRVSPLTMDRSMIKFKIGSQNFKSG